MFVEPFFKPLASTITVPVISNRTQWSKPENVTWGSNVPAAKAYTSVTGNVLFLGCTRSDAATTRAMSTDWNGDVMIEHATAAQDLSNNLRVEVGSKIGGFVGAGTAHATHPADATDRFRLLCAWLMDLDHLRGGVGGHGANVITVSQTFIQATLTVQQVGSQLLAAAWNQNEDTRPWTWTAGWTQVDELILGTGNQICGALATKTSTATGSETVRMTGVLAHSTWGAAVVELLPG